jgi:peptidoglycan hydrolase CwlO-like protein
MKRRWFILAEKMINMRSDCADIVEIKVTALLKGDDFMINKRKNLFSSAIGLGLCFIFIQISTSIGGEAKYEVSPVITLPQYKSETDRAMEAYERMMNRLMDLNEKSFNNINTDVKDIANKQESIAGKLDSINSKLESIDNKLKELTLRMERIEKATEPNQIKVKATVNDDVTAKSGDVNERSKLSQIYHKRKEILNKND